MSHFNGATDRLDPIGFIDKETILKFITQEEVFSLVFTQPIVEMDKIMSPFRNDSTAGCWFEYTPEGRLKFNDFANNDIIKGVKMNSIDCFDAVAIYFNLPNFYATLHFVRKRLLYNKDGTYRKEIIKRPLYVPKKQVEIKIYSRPFDQRDKSFWWSYKISKEQLISDLTFGLKAFQFIGGRGSQELQKTRNITYAFTEFPSDRKKIYLPLSRQTRFLSTCRANDIGGTRYIDRNSSILVITKSYKDYRVLRNLGLNAVWFQNEGMLPSVEKLIKLCSPYKQIFVFFDNDPAGLAGATRVISEVNQIFPGRALPLHLPKKVRGVKDPSDLVRMRSVKQLIDFLIYKNVLF